MSIVTETRFAPDRPLPAMNSSCGWTLPSMFVSAVSSMLGENVSLNGMSSCLPRAITNGGWVPSLVLYALTARGIVTDHSAVFLTWVPDEATPPTPTAERHDG